MNLAEALSELKSTKTRIARLIKLREETISYKKETKGPDRTFKQLTEEIQLLAEKASKLKFKIMVANTTTFFTTKESIQEQILKQGDIRSEIATLKKMLSGENSRFGRGGVFEDYGEKTFQVTQFEIEEKIRVLENQKRTLDSKIQKVNWGTEL